MFKNPDNQILKAVEMAAIASYQWAGRGDEKSADAAAVRTMREELNRINMRGIIKIGEGERDKAPMLHIGEKIGTGTGPEIDIAVDPLEGTTICSRYESGSMVVIAMSAKGSMMDMPDIYMDKIVTKHPISLDINDKPENNLKKLAAYSNNAIQDLKVIILDRPRHQDLIKQIRNAGAKIQLIRDGDISAAINVALGNADMYIGRGGAPEGILAAAALKSLGGKMQTKLAIQNKEEEERARNMGIADLNKVYEIKDMVTHDAIFLATAVTNSLGMEGVKMTEGQHIVQTMILCDNHIKTVTGYYNV